MSTVFSFDFWGNGEGSKVRNSISYSNGAFSFSAKNEFTLMNLDGGARSVKGKSQTVSGGFNASINYEGFSSGGTNYEYDFVKRRQTESFNLFKIAYGIGIGIDISGGVSKSSDVQTEVPQEEFDSPVPVYPKD